MYISLFAQVNQEPNKPRRVSHAYIFNMLSTNYLKKYHEEETTNERQEMMGK
jgi:hypothetical protein